MVYTDFHVLLALSPLWPHPLSLSPCSLCFSHTGLLANGSHQFSVFVLVVLSLGDSPSDTHMAPLPPLSSLCLNVSFSMLPIVTFLPNVANTSHLDAPTHPFPLTLLSFFIWIYLSLLTYYLIHLSVTFFLLLSIFSTVPQGQGFFASVLFTNGSQGLEYCLAKRRY